jgi:hypothetical protein
MKLITKEIKRKACAQFHLEACLDQKVVAKFFDPQGSWSWFLMNQDPDDPDYLWGIVKGFEIEMGSFSLSELEGYVGRFGLKIERDINFKPMLASDVWRILREGKLI